MRWIREKMSQSYEIFVPTIKYNRLLGATKAKALADEKLNDRVLMDKASKELLEYFTKHRYWWVDNGNMIFDSKHGNLWTNEWDILNLNDSVTYSKDLKVAGLTWTLPAVPQVQEIVDDYSFPLITDGRLIHGWPHMMTNQNPIWLNRDYPEPALARRSLVFFLHHNPIFFKPQDTLNYFIQRQWHLRPCDVFPANDNLQEFILNHTSMTWETFCKDNSYFKRNPYALEDSYNNLRRFLLEYQNEDLQKFYLNLNLIVALSNEKYNDYTVNIKITDIWQDIDYITTRLPRIDKLQFNDVEQGIWEFYAAPALEKNMTAISSSEFIRPRNPVKDIRDATVAIDFGTSSTVVAIRENGRDELLRIGMQAKDFKDKDIIADDQYENPTVLEFLDIQKFLQDWQSESYRPLVDWNNIHCSHEARTKLRNNNSNTKVVSSILLRLKQWALRNQQNAELRIKDQNDYEYQLHALEEKNPVKGQPLTLTEDYPELDPIEIYAWFLGMNINWRNRGIFLDYVLTFPVAYPNEVKAKILASFRRGIQRSLPEALIYDERFNDFRVEELESEPAAFAAAALKRLNIPATKDGTAYGVFDFGGGTTDFDYGIYREPNDQEYDEGWDEILEHFGSSGDRFLGGENLLENMAYLVFESNSPECRKQGITFTKPIDAERFAGSETLIAQTQAAYTNTNLMMSKLRPLWENGKIDNNSAGVEKFKLINKDGVATDCELSIKQDMLINYLQERILKGLIDFFAALKVAFEQKLHTLPELIHILLAGNSSRSNIVLGYLGCIDDKGSQELNQHLVNELELIFDEAIPKFEIYEPLNTDPNNHYAATAKTGVALGLLKVAGGEGLKVVNHASHANTDSPFQFFIGGFRRGVLHASIHRGQTYNEWIELGRPLNGVFIMGYTQRPNASISGTINRGETGVYEKKLNLSGNTTNQHIFARVISPNKIEVCTASSLDDIKSNNFSNVRQIELN